MTLTSIRIITDDVQRLVAFYEHATGLTADWLSPAFANLRPAPGTSGGTLAIAGTGTLAFGGTPGIAEAASNRSIFIEFQVADVDGEYERLRDGLVEAFELEPTTMPWGNRSILFRDPDGNLVNLFSPPAG